MNKTKPKIDFIGLGVHRAATTWICKCLNEHPKIFIPEKKELHFFDKDYNYNKGIKYYNNFFPDYSNQSICGEFTPNYLSSPKVPKRIYEHFGMDIKFIVCLRNPVERAFSHYMLKRGKEAEKEKSFEDAISGERRNYYLNKGNYYSNVLNFFKYFDKNNFLFLIFEDIKKNQIDFIQKIYSFLGVNNNFVPTNTSKKINISTNNRNVYVPFINKFYNFLRRNRNNLLLTKFKKILQKTFIIKLLKFIRNKNKKIINIKINDNDKKKKINENTKVELLNFYKKEINNLEKLISLNLEIWRN